MNFFSQMWVRLTTADTPKFFKKVRAFGLSLVALSGSLAVIPGLPPFFAEIEKGLATTGAVMAAVAQMACTDAPDTKPKTDA